jgi:hypothetical protein
VRIARIETALSLAMTDPAPPTTPLDPRARDAAFALAYGGERGQSQLDRLDDAAATARLVPCGAPPDACLAAVHAVRALDEAAIQVADWVHAGALGEAPANELSRQHLARLAPGFTADQYDAALATGLLLAR